MGDLQATIEFSVELYKFFNVDLFQRGLYQVRCALKVCPRLPVQVETTIPETTSNGQQAAPPILNGNHLEMNHTTTSTSTPPTPPLPPPPPPSSSSTGNSMSNGHDFEWRNQQNQKLPQVQQQKQEQEQIDSSFINHQALLLSSTASIINGAGASRIFQILYRNEEISLRDVIYFRTHLLVDSRHIKESIERVEFSLQLELWFAEQNGSPNNLTLASTRTLQLNFHPCRGLHYHLPVLFDYFHLAAVSVAVHASLVALHQPYINAPKNFKPWISGGKLSCRGSMSPGPLEAVFFGPSVINTTKCSGGPAVRLLQTRELYRDVCGLLLKAIENLNMTLNEFSTVLPPNINTQIGSPPFCECDSNERLQKLLQQTKSYDSEEDFVQRANSDIAQLCAESIMLWRRVLVASTQPSVHTLLAKKHHILRVKRFSEGFFVMENSRHAAAGCYDNNYQNYIAIAEMVRRSRYLQCLPPLPIHCIPIDGDANALPLIFEDRYVEVNKISRMRTGSDSHLNCRENQIIAPKKNCVQTDIPVNGRKFNDNECSCGVTYEYKRNHCIDDGLMSHYAMAREILQANLTLSPASAVEDFSDSLRLHQLPRHSLKCLINESNGDVELCGGETDCSSGFCENGISRNFPTTHSKSLDQLDDAVHNKSSTTYNKQTLNYSKTKLFDTDLRYSSQNSETAFVYTDNGANRKLTVKAENLMRHISEFRHKYKNIEESFANSYQFYKDNGYNETRTAGGTLDRQITENGQKSSKFDYLHEIKLLNPPKQLMERHNSYYNSLPKNITNGQVVPKKPYLALNKSQTSQNGINPRAIVWPQKIAITRSNSSQALRSQLNHELRLNPISTIPRSVEIARVRVSDLKEMLKKSNFQKESSSSESDIPSKVKKAKSEEKMLSSNSVDITTTATINAQLIDAERNSNGFSESLPNLGRPPSFHHFINTTGNLSISTSSLSEESGWVSSRHSSMNPSSPDTLTNNEEKKLKLKEINPMDTLLNGEQLRIKLQILLEQQTKAKRHKEYTLNRRPSTLTSLETEPQKVTTITVKLKNERRITKSMAYNESTEVEDSDRIYNNTGKKERRYKKMEKSRSNIDLSCTKESQTITSVRVPPPQQFQDDLLPPDEFRDPPTGQDRQENAKKIINEDNKKKGLKSCNISPIKPIAAASNVHRTSSYHNTTTHSSPSLTVPPALPPPLKDILRLEKVSPKQPVRAIDNPVYHVYESIKPVPASCILNHTQVIRSHSILDMKRAKELTTSIQGHDPIRHLCNGHSNTPNELNNESFLSLQHNGTHVQDTNVMDGNKENSKTSKTNGHFKRFGSTKMKKRGSSSIAGGDIDAGSNDNNISNLEFEKYREEFRKQLKYSGSIYSDFNKLFSELPYFYISDEYRTFSPNGMHLIICVHGLDGNAADLRLVRTYLELGLPGANLEFLMSERNQGDTFSDFDIMTDRLVAEILFHIETCRLNPTRISFVAHSLGTIIVRSALSRPQMRSLLPRLHTFLSLSGPHLGTLYNTSGLVNMGMWFMQKWKKSGSLLQLCMRDASDMRNSFLYRLSQRSTLHHFKNILLCGSSQDRYVPAHSARLELCKAAIRDNTNVGVIYREMVHNIIAPILGRPELALIRYDVHHALPHTANTLIGRAAHIAVLDSELFIEKFLLISGLKYFS